MEYSRAKQILRLAIPLILQQLCLQLQLWIDRAMLGHLDSAFFSAIGNAGTPYHMIVSAITAVCCGTAILVAQSVGAGDLDRVRKLSGASFLGNTLFSLAAFLCLLCFDPLDQIQSDAIFFVNGYQPGNQSLLFFLREIGEGTAGPAAGEASCPQPDLHTGDHAAAVLIPVKIT